MDSSGWIEFFTGGPRAERIDLIFSCRSQSATGLAMADAIVYATAKDQGATVITGGADLKDLEDVIYIV